METILIVDDEKNYLQVLEALLLDEGYEVHTAESAEGGLDIVASHDLDVVITDMKMPGIDGIEFLSEVRTRQPDLPVIMMTAYATVEKAVEAMKKGAFDYITKPFKNEELKVTIRKALDMHRLAREKRFLSRELEERFKFGNIIGKSKAMRQVYDIIEKVGQTRATVLITGESGTGKELIARAIHFNSPRKDKPFISINCSALPETLLESELFGHERGAFTGAYTQRKGRFELAHGGTLFLDEVGEMTKALQVKLLRVLQEMSFERVGGTRTLRVDVRILAASNRNLEEEVMSGRFREDLFYRLKVVHIKVPPLRERRDDIPLLVQHFLKKTAREHGVNRKRLSQEALRHLYNYKWAGNVRELENVIERAVILSDSEVINPEDLPEEILHQAISGTYEKVDEQASPEPQFRHGSLNNRQVRALNFMRENGYITNEYYSQINSISGRHARRDLGQLIEMGLVRRIGGGRSIRYVLK
ncbi:MAG: sigma 54-interacting transcriptional regulator [Deltaproteobacteria bacterium]|nr:sigma 54-interacting transcriptional regulator [Deltaproteobacteria bacterium]MBW2070152.1 sigma 54-interacting transcriptional regulator [Deltaproteobacteria bacterium]